jgi:arsenate reductase
VISIEVLVTPDCPHAEPTIGAVRDAASRLAPESDVRVTTVQDADEASALQFPGSPTVRIDGLDLEVPQSGPPALACRLYEDGSGVPPAWMIEAGLLRALAPRHVLFLCVANSARSQMAEGVGRTVAEAGVRVSSAGSEPSRVRPQAVEVLSEIGIDAGDHRSKSFDEFHDDGVDCVITLCAEENCPVWLGDALRVHWALPDPAAATGSEEQVLDSFRKVRDELVKRLTLALGPTTGRLSVASTTTGADMLVELKIVGMSCEHCTARVVKALGAVEGVTSVEVRLEPASATVTGEDVRLEDLVEAVDRVGFTATAA